MVAVEVKVAEGVYELLWLEPRDVGGHQCEDRIGCNIERDAQKNVCASLVKLAAQGSALTDVKLEQGMARRQRHLLQFPHIPGADDVSAAVRVFPDISDDLLNLVDRPTFRCLPSNPLRTVYWANFKNYLI